MAFTDETRIFVRAGKGGDGSQSFHSEPYKPRGGPDGGDGGKGGSVVLEVSRREHDLSWLARHPHQRGEDGKGGARANRTGRDAEDLVIPVPNGTVVSDERGFVADLVGEGVRVVIAHGGRGGRGNKSLAGPRDRNPAHGEKGESGEEHTIELELRTIADVGLVGLPSAGKSTLLSKLTAATPKIADYPFTTLSPNVGVAGEEDERWVLADVPGLIEGAHEGRGLGHQFLRHVSRCPALVAVVDVTTLDPIEDLRVLRAELEAYDPALADRPTLVAATHVDLIDEDTRAMYLDALREEGVGEVIPVSGITGEGVELLAARLSTLVSRGQEAQEDVEPPMVVLRPGRDPFSVAKEHRGYRVSGRRVERWVEDIDLEDMRELAELQKKLVKEGVERRLAEAGAERGDSVMIGKMEFEFYPDEE